MSFCWTKNLNSIYTSYPEAIDKPIIGITGNYGDKGCELAPGYYKSVIRAGGVPVIIPPCEDKDVIINTLEKIDGLILSGGGDANPLFWGEEPSPMLHSINPERDLAELLTIRLAYNRQIPILGICRGIQMMAVAIDGSIHQDISHIVGVIKHSQDLIRERESHSVKIEDDSILHQIYGKKEIYVNSFHHQGVRDAGTHFRITATAQDGVIEAIESTEGKPMMGVQWHPECLESGAPIFKWLVEQAVLFQQTKNIHNKVLTLDSHCDTPMFFPQGINFGHRDNKILVDLHKMDEGRQDATIMVAYLPQEENVGRKYADNIFDEIEKIQRENCDYLRIAHTPDELYKNKAEGYKSIMLGIENGKALEGKIENVKHFANRGIVYLTLCHNGDNDICDSARGEHTHNGVSEFGEKVIDELNKYGIMVDLSHAAEKSFYDALEISMSPIVCTHSSVRSLCDHPRNLTDEQMKQLALRDGVMQITAYHGFLVKDGEATIRNLMEHLDYAIRIMGIDHVGLGTDFDGDGGVKGLACSSEMLNFTRQMLLRRYSVDDIEKIWGGNFLRLMKQVQLQIKN
ncbi:MAG: membrane dipeptidase [Prevotellaceae bacterium]|nr:membrane dipeptidase [Prevotellaceae bacterium]